MTWLYRYHEIVLSVPVWFSECTRRYNDVLLPNWLDYWYEDMATDHALRAM